MALKVSAKYGELPLFSDLSVGESADIIYNGGAIATFSEPGIKRLPCSGLVMASDVGNGSKRIACGGKLMTDDILLTAASDRYYLYKDGIPQVTWTSSGQMYNNSRTTSNYQSGPPSRTFSGSDYSRIEPADGSTGRYRDGKYISPNIADIVEANGYTRVGMLIRRYISTADGNTSRITTGTYDNVSSNQYMNNHFLNTRTLNSGPNSGGGDGARVTLYNNITNKTANYSVAFVFSKYQARVCYCNVIDVWLE